MHRQADTSPISTVSSPVAPGIVTRSARYRAKIDRVFPASRRETFESHQACFLGISLDEFAIFACLKAQGTGVMVYPGSFSTLAEIADGEHPGAPPELRDLTVVALHLRGR